MGKHINKCLAGILFRKLFQKKTGRNLRLDENLWKTNNYEFQVSLHNVTEENHEKHKTG